MIELETIPNGWTIAKIGELCEVIMGQSPPSETYNTSGVGLPFFQGKKEFTELHPIVEKWCSVPNKIAEINDILISVRAPVGDTNIANQKCCIGRGLAAIRYSYDNKYILYYLKLIKEQLNEKGTGTTFKAISGDLLKQTIIPLAPLNEQKRILAKLEQLLTDLDKGIEYLDTTKQQLKVYRQAVLKWAFEGKLTNTEMSIKKVSDVAFVNPKLPFEKIDDDLEVQFLPMKLVEEVINKINLTAIKKYKEVKKGFTPMTNGDVIFAKITPCMENGKIAVVHSLKNEIAFGSTEFHVFRTKENYLNTYLFHFLVQEKVRQKAEQNMTGAVGQRRVPKKFLEDLEIPTCSFSNQQKIVSEIESRLSVCDKIEETIEGSLQQAEALRLSIIKKAFEGKLVPQDPNDEPAEKLLERIKAAKENGKPEKKEKVKAEKKPAQKRKDKIEI